MRVVLLLFLTRFIHDLPYSMLAAIIMVPGFNLLDFGAFRRLFHISRDDAAVAAVTFIVTLSLTPRLHFSVSAGLGLTRVTFLYRRAHPRIIEVASHVDGTLQGFHLSNGPNFRSHHCELARRSIPAAN